MDGGCGLPGLYPGLPGRSGSMIRGGGGCVVMITSLVVQGGRRTGRLRTGLRVPDSILDSSFVTPRTLI